MLTFTRSFLRQLRVLFSRTIELPHRLLRHGVQFSAGPHGLTIRTQNGLFAAEYRETTPQPPRELVASLALLKAVAGASPDPVTLVTEDGLVTARWHEDRIPRALSDEPPKLDPQLEFPALPAQWSENPPALWQALAAARDTTDALAPRYALGCIQLRGQTGAIAATDGSQLFRQIGFQFGWEEELLVPGSKLFASRELPRNQPVAVGRLDKSVVLRSGKWTFWLPIQEGRFPRVDEVVPAPSSTNTTLYLPAAQQDFLRQYLPRLRCEGPDEPVTIDLNGRVTLRSRENEHAPPKELALPRASYTGPALCIVSNRQYLQRALDLGFGEISLVSPTAPLVCRDRHRTYVWTSVSPESAVKATPDMIVIESPDGVLARSSRRRRTVANSAATSSPPRKSSKPQSQTQSIDTSPLNSAKRGNSARPAIQVSLIEQAQIVQSKLRELLAETSELLRVAKRQRQQERLVRSTLTNLQELQASG